MFDLIDFLFTKMLSVFLPIAYKYHKVYNPYSEKDERELNFKMRVPRTMHN